MHSSIDSDEQNTKHDKYDKKEILERISNCERWQRCHDFNEKLAIIGVSVLFLLVSWYIWYLFTAGSN